MCMSIVSNNGRRRNYRKTVQRSESGEDLCLSIASPLKHAIGPILRQAVSVGLIAMNAAAIGSGVLRANHAVCKIPPKPSSSAFKCRRAAPRAYPCRRRETATAARPTALQQIAHGIASIFCCPHHSPISAQHLYHISSEAASSSYS